MITQTMGKALQASIIATSRQGLFLIPLILILNPVMGLLGIQLATPLADFLGLLITIPIMAGIFRDLSQPDGTVRKNSAPAKSEAQSIE
jgi:Na+-driven multidrug efflux pump